MVESEDNLEKGCEQAEIFTSWRAGDHSWVSVNGTSSENRENMQVIPF